MQKFRPIARRAPVLPAVLLMTGGCASIEMRESQRLDAVFIASKGEPPEKLAQKLALQGYTCTAAPEVPSSKKAMLQCSSQRDSLWPPYACIFRVDLLPRLEVLLREFPHVKIVISSSWREQLLYETLLTSGTGFLEPHHIPVSAFRHRTGNAKEKSSPGSKSTMRSMSPGLRSMMPTGNSLTAKTTWWPAARSPASTTRPVLSFALALKGPSDETHTQQVVVARYP